jgi:hypothetical protein
MSKIILSALSVSLLLSSSDASELQKENPLQSIKEKHNKFIQTDVTLEELDKEFKHPTKALSYLKDIFETFEGTKGENSTIEKAKKILPEDKLLCVHKYLGDKTTDGTPAQITVKATLDNKMVQEYEVKTTVEAEKSGWKITFSQTIDLLTGDKPKINLKEEKLEDGEEKQKTIEPKKITDGIMHVAVYSNKNDLPTTSGNSSATRRKYNLNNMN